MQGFIAPSRTLRFIESCKIMYIVHLMQINKMFMFLNVYATNTLRKPAVAVI